MPGNSSMVEGLIQDSDKKKKKKNDQVESDGTGTQILWSEKVGVARSL